MEVNYLTGNPSLEFPTIKDNIMFIVLMNWLTSENIDPTLVSPLLSARLERESLARIGIPAKTDNIVNKILSRRAICRSIPLGVRNYFQT